MKENATALASELKNEDDVWNSTGDKDFSISNKPDVLDPVEQRAVPKELFENDADLYTDKNITDCHLPELIVCYKDPTFNHVVKDICIDEGTNVKDDINGLKSKSSSQEYYYECGNLKEEGIDGLKSLTVNYSSEDIDPKSSSESDSERDICDPVDELQKSDLDHENVIEKSLEVGELSKQTSLKFLLESSNDAGERSSQEEGIRRDPVLISATEEESNNFVHPKESNEELIKLPNKDAILDGISVGNKVQREAAESSFSVTVPNSGVITYSGPIIYSGSVSLRSDSSTTSTRSFAFPVLQNEWNSSPIRMAKAERGCFQRHKRWKHGLLCCKF